ncbi:MFS transporter [Methanospirillum sp. J.3.6.1-F.2.7.3]|uniref:MFS transporter n=2 Tax=Methanospirillum purgamenti TaxID=2834276 RepID=A0A8E7B0M2_9EURY|nr:MFS transporter [Methanospirillum sp. J.3.6.1-F.2.7.3]MDX8549525.1 MFS transporter [Methanospirillum hungatei]QVV88913.1 MFS transporter [Methanospirillum sp. J.3.6.1-F.2.7.3]
MSQPDSPPKMSSKELLIVLVISLGSFMAGLDATIVNIALPSIAKSFDVPTVIASWVLNAYLIILVCLLLAAAKIGDMKGYKPVFIIGFAIFTTGSALCAMAPAVELLIFFRMIQAVGGAIIAALGSVITQVAAHTIKPSDLAGGFDAAFLFCMGTQIIGLLLILAVKEKKENDSTGGAYATEESS